MAGHEDGTLPEEVKPELLTPEVPSGVTGLVDVSDREPDDTEGNDR
jgi:hypothetical protein